MTQRQDKAARPAGGFGTLGEELQFRLFVEAVTDYAIYILDRDGRVASWNAGAKRIKGYDAADVLGRNFAMFYTPEDRATGLPQTALATAAQEGRFEQEGWRVRKDGTRFWANAVLDRILDGNGRFVGYIKITRDITERLLGQEALERTRQALFQSQKMEAVGQLTGGIAHDFNNLLTIVTGNIELAMQRPEDGERIRRLLGNAMGATERGARLTQQLLSFARRQALRPQSADAGQVIAGFEAVLRRALGEGVILEFSLDPGLDRSIIDVSQLEAALLNLAVNAHDAMPGGGTVRIAAENARLDAAAAEAVAVAPGPYVRVTVTDNGIGMSPETQSRAFEPFFTTKPVGEGSGLGLSQVYGYMRQLGGAATIESAPGQGTAVILLLPTDPAAVTDKPDRAAASLAKVLVVEDDADVLSLAVETLRGLDYEVVTADDGPSALAVLKRSDDIDILFSDIVMPRGMSGVDLAREASRIRPGLRVLLASGYAMPSLLAGDGPEGEYAFIGKPYRGAELARMLRSLSPG